MNTTDIGDMTSDERGGGSIAGVLAMGSYF